MNNKINFIGLGYVGLPTAILLQNSGYAIFGTDIDKKKIRKLMSGEMVFEESAVQEEYRASLKNGIVFTAEYQVADKYIVAVPTPFNEESKKIDPAFLIEACKSIRSVCLDDSLIIIESTVSPKTIEKEIKPLFEGKNVHLAHAPERILPGDTINELKNNSRTIGADSVEIAKKVQQIYESFCQGDIYLTDVKTAEMSKVAENTFRDINIAYANELKEICDLADINPFELIELANHHPRVNILTPGTGVGGHCISVDPWFLVGEYPKETQLIRAAREVNNEVPHKILEKLSRILNQVTSYQRIGVYGLTYKDNVGDVRESPTLQLAKFMGEQLLEKTFFYDPLVSENVIKNQLFDFSEFLGKVDVVLCMNYHDHLFSKQKQLLDSNVIILEPVKKRLENSIEL